MELKLQTGVVTLIDDEDFEKISKFHWNFDGNYVVNIKRCGLRKENKNKKIYLHRFVLDASVGTIVDHINRNKLDNRKFNLRFCTQTENMLNSKLAKNNTSGYKGVYWFKPVKKWCAYITYKKKRFVIGYFLDKNKAVKARNLFEKKLII